MNTVKKHAGHGVSQIKLTNYLLNNLQQFDLKPTTKLVLLYLSGCYNPKHADVFPKQKTIADRMGISEASVIRAIQELHKEGLIVSERKYTNRYKFTARILNLGGTVEDLPQDNKMQDETLQNETSETCNLQPPCNRTISEQEKEPVEMENFKILKEYAEQKGAKNITSYINALKKNGSDKKIIQDYKAKKAADNNALISIEHTSQLIEEYESQKETAVSPKSCERLQEFLKVHRGY